ncbi:MAG: 3'(2'),5'-bisphosphate nucleotidase CysQ [Pseudomonadota bacterium]
MQAPEAERDDADLALLIQAAEVAGDIALRHFSGDREGTEKPDGQGPVTAADLEVDTALRTELTGARAAYGWLSEETPDGPDRLGCDAIFVVDPIDGTRAFIEGSPSWAHSMAIVQNGQVSAGVVYLPALERLYAARRGGGATLNGVPIHGDIGADESAEILASRPNFDPDRWPGGVTPMRRAFRSSLANRLALVGEGRFAAMLSLRAVWDWDVAAGALIASEAGVRVTTPKGGVLSFNRLDARQTGILAAPPELHETLLRRLAPVA